VTELQLASTVFILSEAKGSASALSLKQTFWTPPFIFWNLPEAGNVEDPMVLYQRFRGALPSIDALLEKRGLK
jgi:hypothetical protein